MATKEIPINIKQYYKSMKDQNEEKLQKLTVELEGLITKCNDVYEKVKSNIDTYKNNTNVDILQYEEFANNTYKDGKFAKVAKGLFINRNNNYELVSDLYDLFNLSNLQKQIYDKNKEIEFCNKLAKLNIREYTRILNVYYTTVHKKMILDGNGYAFGNNIGWTCINRCTIKKHKNRIDYAATKKREAELKAAGKRIYNKEEAEWCAKNGIEYKAEDKRVFQNIEHWYEVPLIGCKLPNGTKLKFDMIDYRHASIRGKSNDQLLEECNGDKNKICELKVDLKTKLTLCEKADKILYTKFIRNEDQKPAASTKAYS